MDIATFAGEDGRLGWRVLMAGEAAGRATGEAGGRATGEAVWFGWPVMLSVGLLVRLAGLAAATEPAGKSGV